MQTKYQVQGHSYHAAAADNAEVDLIATDAHTEVSLVNVGLVVFLEDDIREELSCKTNVQGEYVSCDSSNEAAICGNDYACVQGRCCEYSGDVGDFDATDSTLALQASCSFREIGTR